MRCLPRLRAPGPSGFVSSPIPTGSLRAAVTATFAAASLLPQTTPRLNNNNGPTQTRRYLSTTPMRPSQSHPQGQVQSQQFEPAAEEFEEVPEEYYAPESADIQTRLVYPHGITTAPPVSDVTDPAYTPAETADGLEEVGGLADWWDEPTHWGSEGGAAQFVQSVVSPFGPTQKVTDRAMLEVLAKRAIVEALVVARFASGAGRMSKKVDRLFAAQAGDMEQLGKIAQVEIVPGEDGAATLKDKKDWGMVWGLLNSAGKKARRPQQQGQEVSEEGSTTVDAETSQESAMPKAEVKEVATAAQLTLQAAESLIGGWDKAWKKAELRDPVVKFFAAKRIQQLTGHRIPDGKLLAIGSIDSLLKQLVEPPKPKKLAELIETQGVFQELPNVRVFPRRVTPIDKEKMVGRWKIIVKELEKRELPVIGTGDYGPPVEKRWIEGKAVTALLISRHGDLSERTARLSEVLAGIQDEGVEGLAAIAEKLADGARDASLRLPLGDSGLLDHVLAAVPVQEPNHPLNKQALRLVGNACADCDENRARVVNSGKLPGFIMGIIEHPEQDALLPFAIGAALNVCVDYNSEPRIANPNTPELLMDLATSERYNADLDSFMEICTPALAYLTFQGFQPVFLENGGIQVLQKAFHQLYTRFDTADADLDTTSQLKQTLIDWLGSSPPLSQLQTAACLSLGNLGRSDELSTALLPRVQGPLIDILSRAIPPGLFESSNPPIPASALQLTHAALGFLKNLAIPQTNKVPLGAALLDPAHPLLPRLWTSTRTQPQLQFTAVSLTRLLLANCPPNIHHICAPLARSDPNNPSPSNLALLTATAASADEDPIKVEAARAVSLVCRAFHTFPAAVLLDPSWTWAEYQPATTATPDEGRGRQPETEPLTRFYEAHNKSNTIIPSLRHLLTHPRFPSLRSEAIFVLALMSRASSPSSAQVALQVLQTPPTSNSAVDTSTADPSSSSGNGATWQTLAKAMKGSESDELADVFTERGRVEAVDDGEVQNEGKDQDEIADVTVKKLSLEPQQVDPQGPKALPARVAKMDRENAMVLVAELLRRYPQELSSMRRPLEALLNKGGELVMQDRSGTQ
ncbi:hypothetical protein N657DRAFT_611093 [Parathielavia appendiculata]|uniref:Large ribosomal subunit protein mL50 n=1 Tax=Parathielavia appendiculata TaxID=2587402 RepID=A0AAN6U5N4_9PEZI|nr:hypothetical protein N657DRAFT_611093 [Parathielavia appendiculata]